MSFDFSIDDLDIEESPSSIGYALVVALSGVYGYQVVLGQEIDGDYLKVVDNDTGEELIKLEVSYVMGDLFLAILGHVSEGVAEGWSMS